MLKRICPWAVQPYDVMCTLYWHFQCVGWNGGCSVAVLLNTQVVALNLLISTHAHFFQICSILFYPKSDSFPIKSCTHVAFVLYHIHLPVIVILYLINIIIWFVSDIVLHTKPCETLRWNPLDRKDIITLVWPWNICLVHWAEECNEGTSRLHSITH